MKYYDKMQYIKIEKKRSKMFIYLTNTLNSQTINPLMNIKREISNNYNSNKNIIMHIIIYLPVLSAPLGIITSANFFVGKQNSSKAGFTKFIY